MAGSQRVRLGQLSFREAEAAVARGAAALVPMGSTEEHGPHAPLGDYVIADAIAVAVAEATGDVVTPVIPFSYSEYFRDFPGTITVRSETLAMLVEDVCVCLIGSGFRHIVLFNGHNGNGPTLGLLTRRLRAEHGLLIPTLTPLGYAQARDLQAELYPEGFRPGHGGEPVGSLQAYLQPELVDVSRAEEWGVRDFHGLQPDGLSGVRFEDIAVGLPLNMRDVAPASGSLSDPALASAERGRRMFERSVERCAAFVRWFKGIDPRAG